MSNARDKMNIIIVSNIYTSFRQASKTFQKDSLNIVIIQYFYMKINIYICFL